MPVNPVKKLNKVNYVLIWTWFIVFWVCIVLTSLMNSGGSKIWWFQNF